MDMQKALSVEIEMQITLDISSQMTMRPETLDFKRSILIEINDRLEVVRRVSASDQTYLPLQPAAELCFLQFRYVCELLAIGCLIVHQDSLEYTTKLKRRYQADKILDELERLHPDFYPRALEVDDERVSHDTYLLRTRPAGTFLDASGLKKLWQAMGAKLHRGSFNDLKASSSPDFGEIRNIFTSL